MTLSLETVATCVLTVAALATAGVAIKREFAPANVVVNLQSEQGPPVHVEKWRDYIRDGLVLGDTGAPVIVTVFSDFECPFCKRFNARYAEVKAELGDRVALVLLPFPVPGHRFARPSAFAAICAYADRHFEQFHDLLYAKQDSFGLKTWASYAQEAGVDTVALAGCLRKGPDTLRLTRSVAHGETLGVTGTPTVLINDLRYRRPPTDSLTAIIKRALATATSRR